MRQLFNRQKTLFCQWPDHPFTDELKVMSEILDQNAEVLRLVQADLCEGDSNEDIGDQGMTVEQIVRAALLKQMNGWTYEQLAIHCADSEMTRAFVRLNYGEFYGKACLHKNVSRIRAETWQKVSDILVKHAKKTGAETGRTVRMDATVVESNIHNPTDSSLIYDCIRVVCRVLATFRDANVARAFSKTSTRDAKKIVLRILNAKDAKQRVAHYKNLLRLAKTLREQMPRLIRKMERSAFESVPGLARQLGDLKKVAELLPLIISQTERRVLNGESVPSAEKIVSIFEEHTDVIVKGKRETEFGHKMFLTAGTSGLVLDCQLVQGNPNDAEFFIDLIERQKELFGRAPRQTSADGGFASEDNLYDAKDLGVKDVCFSKTCGLPIEEMCKSEWVFQKLRNFRAGIEGVISVLKRAYGLGRAMWKGVRGFAAYVHSSVAAYNLATLARIQLQT